MFFAFYLAVMRPLLLLIALVLAGVVAACKKDQGPQQAGACSEASLSATVIHGRNMCDANGWVLQMDGGNTYPPDALPPAFEQVGMRVCAVYTVYDDPRMCPCCGGKRLRIQYIQQQ